MKTKPDPIDDIRHALRVVGLMALAVTAFCVIRVVGFALAGDWLTTAFNAAVALVFGSAWISTEVRADRYHRFTYRANAIPNPGFHRGSSAWLRQYETKRNEGDAEEEQG